MNKVLLSLRNSLILVFYYMFDNFLPCSLAETDLSAQNALHLLLNMSNARELVGNALQVGALTLNNTHRYSKRK